MEHYLQKPTKCRIEAMFTLMRNSVVSFAFPSLYAVQCFTVGKKWPHLQFPILGGQKIHTIKYKFWDHKNQCPPELKLSLTVLNNSFKDEEKSQ